MKAIVMAGGDGVRLRPLTDMRPKPMVDFFGRPLLDYTVRQLKEQGFQDICFTLRYKPEMIMDYFGTGEAYGVNISYLVEGDSLGTAGGVRACSDFIDGDDVLIVSGDAVWSFDLAEAMRIRKKKKADALIVLYNHTEPTEYGVAVTDENGRILRFSEKPAWENVVTDTVSTGFYVLTAKTVSRIPRGVPCDFGKDFFPRLMTEKAALYGEAMEGYWCDIGSPESYRDCILDILDGKTVIKPPCGEKSPGVWSCDSIPDGACITPPVFLGKGCVIEPGAAVERSVIGCNSFIGAGANISSSLLGSVQAGRDCVIRGSLAGSGITVEDGGIVTPGCVIGDNVKICAGAALTPGSNVNAGTETEGAKSGRICLIPDGMGRICGTYPDDVDAEYLYSLGTLLGEKGRVMVAFCGGEGARSLASAAACGINCAGAEAVMCDCGTESTMSWCCTFFMSDGGIFVRQTDNGMCITLFGRGGTRGDRDTERRIMRMRRGANISANKKVGIISHISGTQDGHIAAIVGKYISNFPINIRAHVQGGHGAARMLRRAMILLGAEITEDPAGAVRFAINPDGYGLNVADEDGNTLPPEKTAVLTAISACIMGEKKIAVTADTPDAVSAAVKPYGTVIVRCGSDPGAEKLLMHQRFMFDGVQAACLILCAMSVKNTSAREFMGMVPQFFMAAEDVVTALPRAAAMRGLYEECGSMSAELGSELTLRGEKGVCRAHPVRDGNALRLTGEAATEQDARDMLRFLAKRLGENG